MRSSSASIDSTIHGPCSIVVFIIEKYLCISGSSKFKLLFEENLALYRCIEEGGAF